MVDMAAHRGIHAPWSWKTSWPQPTTTQHWRCERLLRGRVCASASVQAKRKTLAEAFADYGVVTGVGVAAADNGAVLVTFSGAFMRSKKQRKERALVRSNSEKSAPRVMSRG